MSNRRDDEPILIFSIKVLAKTSTKPTKSLAENSNWTEIATLTRLALIAGNQSKQTSHNQLYVPEISYIVSVISGTGDTLVRKSVYGIVMNLLQALYLARGDDTTGPDLRLLIDECTQPEVLRLFGLVRLSPTSEYTNLDPANDSAYIDTQESLTQLLVRIMEVTSGSNGTLHWCSALHVRLTNCQGC